MRAMHSRIWRKEIEPHRVRSLRVSGKQYGTDPDRDGRNGLFRIPRGLYTYQVIASDDSEGVVGRWEHVSFVNLSEPDVPPDYEEMTWAKNLFWSEEETVVHYWVPASDHINQHPGCVHLWSWAGGTMPRPPQECV